MKKEVKEKIEYHNWKKTAEIANKYGKDGWISTLKNAIDILILEEKQKWAKTLIKKIDEVYKKEGGIHNWLDLGDELKRK